MTGHRAQSGFSLLELSIALIIIAVMVSASVAALRPAAERADALAAERFQEIVRQSLVNFARTHHRLPCPDVSGDGYEDDCPTSGIRNGAVPFYSLEMTIATSIENSRSGAENLLYGVYRNDAIDADLTVLEERTGDQPGDADYRTRDDFRQALINAAQYHADNGVGAEEIHVTGDGVTSGPEDCADNRVVNMAFVLISAGARDMNEDGNAFDGVNGNWQHEGNAVYCAGSPSRSRDNVYDDTVVAINFYALLGLMD